jgi:hypothetical protein
MQVTYYQFFTPVFIIMLEGWQICTHNYCNAEVNTNKYLANQTSNTQLMLKEK